MGQFRVECFQGSLTSTGGGDSVLLIEEAWLLVQEPRQHGVRRMRGRTVAAEP
jgi:hypothetical protein